MLDRPDVPTLTGQDLLDRLMAGDRPFLLDVREPHEHAAGRLAGCVLIPLGELAGRTAELPRDREIVVVCRSGRRCAFATHYLLQEGFRATNMGGGMLAWTGEVDR